MFPLHVAIFYAHVFYRRATSVSVYAYTRSVNVFIVEFAYYMSAAIERARKSGAVGVVRAYRRPGVLAVAASRQRCPVCAVVVRAACAGVDVLPQFVVLA